MKVAIIGAGSYTWSLGFVRQFVHSETLTNLELSMMDINPERLETLTAAAHIYNKSHGTPIRIEDTNNADTALNGSDFVIVCISTGGLEAMRIDIEIPEKYGIWHTVGDTVGPGGWSRAVRNIPVFNELAAKMKKHCPDAWLINVTNPLTVLTRLPQRNFGIKTVGMCPGVEEQARAMASAAGISKDNIELSFRVVGIDHCSYFLDLFANGIDVLDRLKEMGYFRNDGILPKPITTNDPMAEGVANRIIFMLWHNLGYLPAISDRHAVENYPQFQVSKSGKLPYDVERTNIAQRQTRLSKCRTLIESYIKSHDDNSLGPLGHGDDPVVQVIESLSGKRSFLWCSNYMNIGQLPDFLEGAVVETRCLFDKAGVHPLCSKMPDILKPIVLPHVLRQEISIDIILHGSFNDLVALVGTDPMCCQLSFRQCSEMLREMLTANKTFIKNPKLLEF